jgi:hypothetical protein
LLLIVGSLHGILPFKSSANFKVLPSSAFCKISCKIEVTELSSSFLESNFSTNKLETSSTKAVGSLLVIISLIPSINGFVTYLVNVFKALYISLVYSEVKLLFAVA